jgi:putative PIN family toxin of toxin-antitoxin system
VTPARIIRVVFDTNVVLSALLFPSGRLAWLRPHWSDGSIVPIVSPATAQELIRVLGYSRLKLQELDRLELIALYIPYCERVIPTGECPIVCRDPKDQSFLHLAHSGKADLLVTGDKDLLVLAGQTQFIIEHPEHYRGRVLGPAQS